MVSFISAQLQQPSGWFGRLVLPWFFNRYNAGIIRLTVHALNVQPADRVLDIGFGGGLSLELLATRASRGKVHGVDLSADIVRRAERRYAALIKQGRLVLKMGDMARLPYDNSIFDKVCTINTIYFWSDALDILGELRRVLRPGGRLVIAFRSREKMQTMKLFLDRRFTLYHPEEVRALLIQAKFNDVRLDAADQNKRLDSHLAIGTA